MPPLEFGRVWDGIEFGQQFWNFGGISVEFRWAECWWVENLIVSDSSGLVSVEHDVNSKLLEETKKKSQINGWYINFKFIFFLDTGFSAAL